MPSASPPSLAFALPQADDKPAYVRALFARIAGHYDLMNDLMTGGLHRAWKAQACAALNLQAGDCALDLCCGTGDLALALLRRTPQARVTALDFCEEMLAIARRRLRARYPDADASRYEVVQGDALRLPFEDAAFDGVIVGYGLRNVSDLDAALRESARVLKPGGRLAILETSRPSPLIEKLSGFWRYAALPALGGLIARDSQAYRYLPHSADAFPDQRALAQKMTDAGLRDVRFENLLRGVCALHTARR